MYFLGIDVGTTRCKAGIFDPEGKALAVASREYGYTSPRAGWAEQNPLEVWERVKEVIREVLGRGIKPSFLSVSAQGEAVIFLDAKGEILRPAILGMDMRATQECNLVAEHFTPQDLLWKSGVPLHPITTLTKILWVKNHEPHIFACTHKFLCYEDFIFWKLSGEAVIDYSMAGKTLMFDIQRRNWSPEILQFLGIEERQLASCLSSGTAFTRISAYIAEELGLPMDLQLVTGGHDQCCAALGSGAIRGDIAFDNVGTAEVFGIPTRNRTVILSIEPLTFSCYNHVVPDTFLLTTLNQSAGLLLRWYRDVWGRDALEKEKREGMSAYQILIAKAWEQPANVLVLPHLTGSGTPWIDPLSRAAIVGMTLHSDEGEIVRALMESIVFELRINIEIFEKKGIHFDKVRTTGGCARSKKWLQIRADILGKPVQTLAFEDASLLGAGILAAYGGGTFRNFEEAVAAMVDEQDCFEPHPSRSCLYTERFQIYKDLYPALAGIHHRIAEKKE